jgi:hypothetical protein
MLTLWSWIPFFIPLVVALVITLVNQDEPPTEELDNWDNGLASATPTLVDDPFANHPMHCKCYHHS